LDNARTAPLDSMSSKFDTLTEARLAGMLAF